jgi:hypothetical protein
LLGLPALFGEGGDVWGDVGGGGFFGVCGKGEAEGVEEEVVRASGWES